MYITKDYYDEWMQVLGEMDDPSLLTTFASYFNYNEQKKYYVVTDADTFLAWLSGLSEEPIDFAWSGSEQIKSTQLGGKD